MLQKHIDQYSDNDLDTSPEKKELAKDITPFANEIGGLLLHVSIAVTKS